MLDLVLKIPKIHLSSKVAVRYTRTFVFPESFTTVLVFSLKIKKNTEQKSDPSTKSL